MKKWMLSMMVLCLCIIAGCSKEEKIETKHIMSLSAEDASRKIQRGKESFLLFLTSSNCYSCKEYDKVLKKLQKDQKFDIYFVKVDDEEKDKLRQLNLSLGDYETLPMTYYIQKGNIKDENKKEGYMEKDEFEAWLKQLNILS